jgi:hypothetical protein
MHLLPCAIVACLVVLTGCGGDGGRDGASPAEPTGAPSGGAPSSPASPTSPTTRDGLPRDVLLPNMRSLTASDLRVAREEGERRLRFAGSLANLGPGPMVVRPGSGPVCPRRQIAVRQLVHRDTGGDGAFQRGRDPVGVRRAAGCMLDHPTHDHWHFDAMAGYSLRRPGGAVLVQRDKVSFCLRDNRRAEGAARSTRRAYFGECGRRTDQGISPGWVDVYDADLDGQYLTLPPRTPLSTVCLVVTADPHDQLRETDETDNTSVLALRITGTDVRRASGGCDAAV